MFIYESRQLLSSFDLPPPGMVQLLNPFIHTLNFVINANLIVQNSLKQLSIAEIDKSIQ